MTSGQDSTSHNHHTLDDGSGNRTDKQETNSAEGAFAKTPEGLPGNSECSNCAPSNLNTNSVVEESLTVHLNSNLSTDAECAIPEQYPPTSPVTEKVATTFEDASTQDLRMRKASSAEQFIYEISVLAYGKELADSFRADDIAFLSKRLTEGTLNQLVSTEPRYGGVRWWFLCPNCDRRVSRVHLPIQKWFRFFCRHCYDSSQASGKKSERFFKVIARDLNTSTHMARLWFRGASLPRRYRSKSDFSNGERNLLMLFGVPYGNRTRVAAVKEKRFIGIQRNLRRG
jgi:hypothetical protein